MKFPLALFIYNRPQTLARTLTKIREIRPAKLYVFGDGPKPKDAADAQKCLETRALLENLDWPCDVIRSYNSENKGLKKQIEDQLTFLFSCEDAAVILEDDCLPENDFFSFCSELLEKYRHEERVGCITGDNFQDGLLRGGGSYYFSKYPHCWGWATWRRSWKKYSAKMEFWPAWRNSSAWLTSFANPRERLFWEKLFEQQFCGEIDSWAYPWTASLWHAGCLTVTPQHNLVQNIGFGEAATHTKNIGQNLSIPTKPLKITKYPKKILPHVAADRHVFKHVFCEEKKGLGIRIRHFLQFTRAMLRKNYE